MNLMNVFIPYKDQSPESVRDYILLLKPRVMSLVVFSGLCGLLMAPGHIHPFLGFVAVFCIALGAGAAGCLNMWYERDLDALMRRTENRPLPQHRLDPRNALAFGTLLSCCSVAIMGVGVRWTAAFWLAITILFYVFVYTIFLKPRTPQNIVIGGASGALPPVIGWVCVTGETSIESWLLFAIIFLWTPPHFWALSLYRTQDYERAKIPMLPVVAGVPSTKRQIVFYSFILFFVSLIPEFVGMTSRFYTFLAMGLGVIFVAMSLRVLKSADPRPAFQLFTYSLLYLFLLFLGLTLDRMFL